MSADTVATSAAEIPPPATPIDWVEVPDELNVQHTVQQLIQDAIDCDASDIFFACGESGIAVSRRRMGLIEEVTQLPGELGRRCLGYLRVLAAVRLEERRHPQDGRWQFESLSGQSIDLRLNTMPTLHGESIAIRLLVRDSHLLELESLGLVGPQLGLLRDLLHRPSGLILVTGPTGSGKTTTLYACLHHLNDGYRKIHTLEDPIEYAMTGLQQTQVCDFAGADFHEMLRAVLRQNPDVIMIGEVRDRITAETAVRAANSGQVVFATLHTATPATAVQCLLSLGVAPFMLATSLAGVIGQRLLRTLDRQSRVALAPAASATAFSSVDKWLDNQQEQQVYAARPAEDPNAGYEGRTATFEILTISDTLRDLVAAGEPAVALRRQAISEGMFTFREAALLKVATGLASFDEVLRVVPRDAIVAKNALGRS